jgi:hypothetical protein
VSKIIGHGLYGARSQNLSTWLVADRRTVAMTNTYGSSSEDEIEVHSDQPRARLWDRIADVFGPGEYRPRTSSTALAVLAYVSGAERVEEGR